MIIRIGSKKFRPAGYYLMAALLLTAEKFIGYTNYIMLLITAVSAFLLLLHRVEPVETCMVSLILPGEIWVLLMLGISLCAMNVKGEKIKIPVCGSRIKLCLFSIALLSVITAIWSGQIYNAIFYCVYLLLLFFAALVLRNAVKERRLTGICLKLCWIQIFLTIMEIIRTREFVPGDNHFGSLKEAHEFGVWLLFMITFLTYQLKKEPPAERRRIILAVLGCLIALYLADAKHAILAYAMGAAIYIFLRMAKAGKYFVFLMMTAVIVMVYIGTFALQAPPIRRFIEEKFQGQSIYLYDEDYNYKYNYFYGTLSEELTGIRFFTGFGLGQYGSRGANLFAYDVMYRSDNALNRFIESHFPAACIENYKKYVQVYTDELVEVIQWRSAVLTYPFNSFLAFIGENGLIGIICWTVVINEFFKRSNYKLLLCFFVMLCLFDLYIDRINIIGTLIILLFSGTKQRTYAPMERRVISAG